MTHEIPTEVHHSILSVADRCTLVATLKFLVAEEVPNAEVKGKRVLVIGYGRRGHLAAEFAFQRGAERVDWTGANNAPNGNTRAAGRLEARHEIRLSDSRLLAIKPKGVDAIVVTFVDGTGPSMRLYDVEYDLVVAAIGPDCPEFD